MILAFSRILKVQDKTKKAELYREVSHYSPHRKERRSS